MMNKILINHYQSSRDSPKFGHFFIVLWLFFTLLKNTVGRPDITKLISDAGILTLFLPVCVSVVSLKPSRD